MEKERIYRAWLVGMKDNLARHRISESYLSLERKEPELEQGSSDAKMQTQEEGTSQRESPAVYTSTKPGSPASPGVSWPSDLKRHGKFQSRKIRRKEKKVRDEITSTADEIYQRIFAKDDSPQVLFEDTTAKHRWLMHHIIHAAMSCAIGGVILFFTTLFFHFINTGQGTDKVLEDISYALLVAFIGLVTNNAIAVFLTWSSFNSDAYHKSALELQQRLTGLRKDLLYLEGFLGNRKDRISQKLISIMIPSLEGPLYKILETGFTGKEEVMKIVNQIKHIVEQDYSHGNSGEQRKPQVARCFTEEEVLFERFYEKLRRLSEVRKRSLQRKYKK